MPSPKTAFSPKRAVTPQLVDQMEGQRIDAALHQRLAERAYALYEESGRQDGNDQKNWLKAKSEIVQSLEMRKSGTWVALTASMPGASPDSIRVYVDTNRVVVEAEKIARTSAAEGAAHGRDLGGGADSLRVGVLRRPAPFHRRRRRRRHQGLNPWPR